MIQRPRASDRNECPRGANPGRARRESGSGPDARRLAVAGAVAVLAGSAAAQSAAPLVIDDARTRLGGEIVHLPGGERLGMVGLTELVSVGGEWWAGPGVYGAATGQRGGLFVPGVEGAWSHPFRDWIAVDAGLFVGGGGGGNAPVGGGLMLRPHADLVFRLPGFYTGPTFSEVRFANGSIRSHQFGWMFNFDSPFRYRPADSVQDGQATDGRASGLGFDRIDATFTMERPHSSTSTTGQPMTRSIGLVGLRAEHDVDGPLWAGIETAGAASGGVAGYAEILGTAGLRWSVVPQRLDVHVRGALGLGGGGGINTGGGLLAKAALGATLQITDTVGLGAEAGLADAPRHANFKAETAALSLSWRLDTPHHDPFASIESAQSEATTTEFFSGAEHFQAARKQGPTRALDAVAIGLDRFITPHVYVTGQAHSAFAGGAGAYSEGLFGLGTQWPVVQRVRVGVEALAGAAGGGGVDTQGGAILQGRGYAEIGITEGLALRVGAGKIKSVHGGVDAPTVDAALVFRFGVDRRR